MAIKTFRCRFFPNHAPTPGRGELTEYLVPVSWWSYDDFPVTWGRMDDRGPAVQTKAQVEVQAYSPKEARTLVFREFGDYGRVGTAVKQEVVR